MYNPNDIQFVGKHDYDRDAALTGPGLNKTFSVGIFKWELKSSGKQMKKGKCVVRVAGEVAKAEDVFKMAENIVSHLDSDLWDGRKTVKLK